MPNTKLNVICIVGGPGSGKTTLSTALMHKIPNSIILKSGSLLRASLCFENGDSKRITSIIEKGRLVDDKIVAKVITEEISKIFSKDNVHNVILDGYPRSLEQLQLLNYNEINLCGIIILEAPDLILEKRCKIRNLRTDRIDDLQEPVMERVLDFRLHIDDIITEIDKRKIKYFKISTCGSVEDTIQNAITFALQLNL